MEKKGDAEREVFWTKEQRRRRVELPWVRS